MGTEAMSRSCHRGASPSRSQGAMARIITRATVSIDTFVQWLRSNNSGLVQLRAGDRGKWPEEALGSDSYWKRGFVMQGNSEDFADRSKRASGSRERRVAHGRG